MPKTLITVFFMLVLLAPLMAQLPTDLSPGELRRRLQHSKPDSNRILLLHALGKSFLAQEYGDRKNELMDAAIGLFDQAAVLSDSLQLQPFQYESMMLAGAAWLGKEDTAQGKRLFTAVAAHYHAAGDWQREAATWLRLARSLNWYTARPADIIVAFRKAAILYKQVDNIDKAAESQASLADFLYRVGEYNQAENEALQSLQLFQQIGSVKVAQVYYILSTLNRYRGAYEKSLFYATRSAESAERNKGTRHVDNMFGELALVYDELGRAEESSLWYRKTLIKRIEQKEDRALIFRTGSFLIRQLVKLQRSRQALSLMDSLVSLDPPQSQFEQAIVAQNYAYCFDGLKQYAAAEKQFLAMGVHYRKAPLNRELMSMANMDMGRFYLQHGQFAKAHGYLDSSLAYRSDDRLVDQRDLYHMLFAADSALGNYQAAIKNLQQYQFLDDSIYNERKSRQIEELTIQYETKKKEQDIALLEKEKRLQQVELTKEKNTRRWILGVAILLIIIVALLVNYARLKQRTNATLRVQQLQIGKKNETLQHLVEEKEWLVREIHHRVKNNFHTVMGLLRTQSAYLQGEEAIEALAESQQRIQAMSLVHQKLYQSDNLSAINMAAYIHELVDYLQDSFHTGRSIRFNLQIEPVTLHIAQCIPLGLILNEAITNAIKYAFPDKRAGKIDVALVQTAAGHFTLSIKDNGVGLPASFMPENSTSLGMRLMRGLSGDLDTNLQVIDDNGTEIRLDFISEA